MVGVLDILGAVLFFSSEWTVAVLVCTIKKNMRCEVMTIQNYCYALMSCQIFFLLTDHAVGTGVTAFGMFGVTCIGRDLLPFFISPLLWHYKKVMPCSPCQHCSKPKHTVLYYVQGKGSFLSCSQFFEHFIKVLMPCTLTNHLVHFISFSILVPLRNHVGYMLPQFIHFTKGSEYNKVRWT